MAIEAMTAEEFEDIDLYLGDIALHNAISESHPATQGQIVDSIVVSLLMTEPAGNA